MYGTKEIREKFGLSQAQLAQYLSITRSLLSLNEIGRRDLPTAAMVKLSELLLFIHQPPVKRKSVHPHVKALEEKTHQLLRRHAKEQQYQQQLAEKKLVAMQKRHGQNLRLLDLVDHLTAKNKNLSRDANQTAWLKMIEAQALKTFESIGPHKQTMLQLKISGIKYEYEQAMLPKGRITNED